MLFISFISNDDIFSNYQKITKHLQRYKKELYKLILILNKNSKTSNETPYSKVRSYLIGIFYFPYDAGCGDYYLEIPQLPLMIPTLTAGKCSAK